MHRAPALIFAFALCALPGWTGEARASEATAEAKAPGAISSAQIRSKLPGLWRADLDAPPLSVKATSNYLRDGTVIYEGHITGPDMDVKYKVKAKWVVDGDVVETTILESNRPDLLAVGSSKRDRIVELDDKHFTYLDRSGTRNTETLIRR